MDRKKHKKYRILSRIIAMVIIQGLVLSGLLGVYCGKALCQKTDNLSPHINISNIEVKDMFNSLSPDEKDLSRRDFLKKSGKTVLVVVGALIFKESFLARYLLPKSGISIAEAAWKTEEELDDINLTPQKRFDLIAQVVNGQLTQEGAMENVIKLFEGKKYKRITDTYEKIRPIIVSTGMDEDILYAMMLTETDLRGVVTSKKSGAYGPLQVMKGTVKNCNNTMARWEKKRHKPEAYKIVLKLIGSNRIEWNRMNDFEYSFRIGAAVAYIKYNHLVSFFERKGIVYNKKSGKWEFKKHGKGVMPIVYKTTTALIASYNGPGPGRVLDALKSNGTAPIIRPEIKEKGLPYYDENQSEQRGGWLEGKAKNKKDKYYWIYKSETIKHYIRLWRYYNAMQKYKKGEQGNQVEEKKSKVRKRIDEFDRAKKEQWAVEKKRKAEKARKKKEKADQKPKKKKLLRQEKKKLEEKLESIREEVEAQEKLNKAIKRIKEKLRLEQRLKEIEKKLKKEKGNNVINGIFGTVALKKLFKSKQYVIINQSI